MGIVRSGKRATPESHVRTLRVCTRLLSGTSRMLSTLLAAALIENSVAWPTRRKSLPDPPASAASASAPALVPSPSDDFLRDNPMAPWSTSTSRIRMFPSPRGSIGLPSGPCARRWGSRRRVMAAQRIGAARPTPIPPPPARSARTPAPLELFPVSEALLPPRLDVDGSREAREPPPGHPLTPKGPMRKFFILPSAERASPGRAKRNGKGRHHRGAPAQVLVYLYLA